MKPLLLLKKNRLITNDIPSLLRDPQVRNWAKTLNGPLTYKSLSPDSVPVLLVKNANAVRPDFSVVSVVSAPYGLVSQSAVAEFNVAVDTLHDMLFPLGMPALRRAIFKGFPMS